MCWAACIPSAAANPAVLEVDTRPQHSNYLTDKADSQLLYCRQTRDTQSLFASGEAANPFAIPADEDLFRLQVRVQEGWWMHTQQGQAVAASMPATLSSNHHQQQRQHVHNLYAPLSARAVSARSAAAAGMYTCLAFSIALHVEPCHGFGTSLQQQLIESAHKHTNRATCILNHETTVWCFALRWCCCYGC